VQEDHDLLDLFLFLPGQGNETRPLGADIRHLAQQLRLCLDHLQRTLAEVVHNALCQARTDALDQA